MLRCGCVCTCLKHMFKTSGSEFLSIGCWCESCHTLQHTALQHTEVRMRVYVLKTCWTYHVEPIWCMHNEGGELNLIWIRVNARTSTERYCLGFKMWCTYMFYMYMFCKCFTIICFGGACMCATYKHADVYTLVCVRVHVHVLYNASMRACIQAQMCMRPGTLAKNICVRVCAWCLCARVCMCVWVCLYVRAGACVCVCVNAGPTIVDHACHTGPPPPSQTYQPPQFLAAYTSREARMEYSQPNSRATTTATART